MAVQSIRAPIEKRDVAGDHLLMAARQVSFGKMDGVGKFNHLSQKVRPRAKALDDAGYLLSSRACAPKIVCRGNVAGSFSVFGDPDLYCRLCVKFGGLGFFVHDCELYFLCNFCTAEHWIIGADCILLEDAVDWNPRRYHGHSEQGFPRAVSCQQHQQQRHQY